MLRLRCSTPPLWLPTVLQDLDAFLQDHAANERKVSASAIKLAVQHPHRQQLVAAMIDLAREELEHFQIVYQVLRQRGRALAFDVPDPYMGALQTALRKRDTDAYLLDRLLAFAVVEARACERFQLLGDALDGQLQQLYRRLTRAEAQHHALFTRLANAYFPADVVTARLDAILDAEAAIVTRLPLRPALH
ncbi:MAG TPA: tRNA-(ms[2]io[6]A)-hydroxylase [Terriglobales bacterium]|nr:tRNA-(ms[2]io[6]A)-hydroxylase [Terriglobales bacterium]